MAARNVIRAQSLLSLGNRCAKPDSKAPPFQFTFWVHVWPSLSNSTASVRIARTR